MIDPLSIVARLPPPAELERRMAAVAMIELILDWRWNSCDYRFSREGEEQSGQRYARMWNGCGDMYTVVFLPDGQAALKGNAHEHAGPCDAYFRRIGVFDGIPSVFSDFIAPPTGDGLDPVTFALWFTQGCWTRSASLDPDVVAEDGSGYFLHDLIGSADQYVAALARYRDLDVPVEVIKRFFAHEPLTFELACELCGDVSFAKITEWFDKIPYPLRDETNHPQLVFPFATRGVP